MGRSIMDDHEFYVKYAREIKQLVNTSWSVAEPMSIKQAIQYLKSNNKKEEVELCGVRPVIE